MVVLDTHTGEVKALVGGRNYRASQLNRAEAQRQPGSAFKPFVYAAALSSTPGTKTLVTPATTIEDEPTTFQFRGEAYTPGNYEGGYMGTVTLRYALAHSLNIPAIKLAEQVGYEKVARLADAAGLGADVKPTPSIALGAYDASPLQIASGYTIFANGGNWLPWEVIRAIRDQRSRVVFDAKVERKPVLDSRVAYLVESMMEEVVRSGTGAAVRTRGFMLPAAGKTGSSRDAWFAGFTSKLLCVVWVGFDDNRDLKLAGADSALPIWTEFMKRAHKHGDYKDAQPFPVPSGIVSADIDSETGELAGPGCYKVRREFFIAGTQPKQACHLHGEHTIASGADH
jgi:penicillin-binding protein 1B